LDKLATNCTVGLFIYSNNDTNENEITHTFPQLNIFVGVADFFCFVFDILQRALLLNRVWYKVYLRKGIFIVPNLAQNHR
jgi:uncharacterized membrane protein